MRQFLAAVFAMSLLLPSTMAHAQSNLPTVGSAAEEQQREIKNLATARAGAVFRDCGDINSGGKVYH